MKKNLNVHISSLQATLEDMSHFFKKAKNEHEMEEKKMTKRLELFLPTILSCGLIAEKEPGCPM